MQSKGIQCGVDMFAMTPPSLEITCNLRYLQPSLASQLLALRKFVIHIVHTVELG